MYNDCQKSALGNSYIQYLGNTLVISLWNTFFAILDWKPWSEFSAECNIAPSRTYGMVFFISLDSLNHKSSIEFKVI